MRRVVVTGLGAVSPCGKDVASTWDAICQGRSGIGKITQFDAGKFAAQIAGECSDFDALKYIEKKRLREGERFTHMAVAASQMAVDDSGFADLPDSVKERTGTIVGVGIGGLGLIERQAAVLAEKGPRRVTPYFIPATISNLAAGTVSMRFGMKGPSYATTSACSSGAHAIGEATRWIQRGDIDMCIAGGAEAAVTGLAIAGFASMRALSKRNDDPERASRPFDQDRDGFVLGEGAGILMLEEREAALRRGARIYAEVSGYGATADAYHLTLPAPEHAGAQRAMRQALADAKLAPSDISYLNAHGTSTPAGDTLELEAASSVFGAYAKDGLLISSTKSMTGHLLGAAGGLESVLCALALDAQIAPPTINLDNVDEKAVGYDLVPGSARNVRIDAVLNNSFGFGGTNVALVMKRHD